MKNYTSLEILTCLLRFFASSPDEQAKQLDEYYESCKISESVPHLDDPLVELSEALWSYTNRFTVNRPETDDLVSMFANDDETALLLQELAALMELMWKTDTKELFEPNHFKSIEWRILRRYSGDALLRCQRLAPGVQLSLFDLMLEVAD